MAETTSPFSDNLKKLLERMAQEGITHAAEGLSTMVGEKVTVADPSAKLVH